MNIQRIWPLANDHLEGPLQGSRFNLVDLSRTICSCFTYKNAGRTTSWVRSGLWLASRGGWHGQVLHAHQIGLQVHLYFVSFPIWLLAITHDKYRRYDNRIGEKIIWVQNVGRNVTWIPKNGLENKPSY